MDHSHHPHHHEQGHGDREMVRTAGKAGNGAGTKRLADMTNMQAIILMIF